MTSTPLNYFYSKDAIALYILSPEGHSSFFQSSSSTASLVIQAESAVKTLLAGRTMPPEPLKYTLSPHIDKICIKLDMLLLRMLQCSINDKGRRYTASVILTAQEKDVLPEVANAWLVHLFYPIQACNYFENRPARSSIETAILYYPTSHRQGHKCPVSHVLSPGYEPYPDALRVGLIMPDLTVEMYSEVTRTLDPDFTIQILKDWGFDGEYAPYRVYNGIMLDVRVHHLFITYLLAIVPADPDDPSKSDAFKLKFFPECKLRNGVTGHFSFAKGKIPNGWDVPVPKASHLALHAAFCDIFYESRAASFFEYAGVPEQLKSMWTTYSKIKQQALEFWISNAPTSSAPPSGPNIKYTGVPEELKSMFMPHR